MSRLDEILALPKVTHNLVQGSAEWQAFRLEHDGASEAAAVLGLSKNMQRNELLRMKHTGIAREFSEWLQKNVLDHGHAVEAKARPHVEKLIGEELYPVTCSRGLLSASCDGLDMADRKAFEHKQYAEDLAAMVGAGVVPDEHMPQCQQVLLVTGAEELIFVVSDGTPERMVWAKVTPDRAWWERIVDGWDQFNADRAVYEPRGAEPPKPLGRPPESLPALRIELTGAVTASNLAEFKETALGAIRSVNRELTTDEHFADAEHAVKWCGEVESRIKAAKDHALSQTASIDALFRTLDEVSAEARRVRLDLEKIVERRKIEIKGELVAAAKRAYETHEAAVRQETGAWQAFAAPDFAAAIKGKRSVEAMRDALDTALANGKIKVDEAGRKIRAALVALDAESAGFEHLFHDRLSFIGFGPQEVRALVRARITEHRAAEERRAAELAERERVRIRAEEEARAQHQQQERIAQELRQREEADAAQLRQEREQQPAAADHYLPASQASTALAPSPGVVPIRRVAAAPATQPTLRLGEINKRIAPLSIDAAGLASLGFQHAKQEGAAKLWHEHQFDAICIALMERIETARVSQLRAA